MSTTKVSGYFTIESSIEGLTSREMERVLGLPDLWLADGCVIFALVTEPAVGQFEQRGSTRYPGGDGLDLGVLKDTTFKRPTAWLNRRLVKVRHVYEKDSLVPFPKSSTPVEQWELTEKVDAYEICRLNPGVKYWSSRYPKAGG
jgi:hypothetical protein